MQTSISVEALLSQTELFRDFDPAQLAITARMMTPVSFQKSAMIFSRGDAGKNLYLVLEGRVRLSVLTEDGRELAFTHAREGEVFGEIAAFDGGPRTADASALTSVKAMSLSRANIDRLLVEVPAFARAVMVFLCKRLRFTDVKLETIVMHSIEVRLSRLLLGFARVLPLTPKQTKATIRLDLSQSELGLLIGASRPKVNAALVGFMDEGIIEQQGKDLICDLVALQAIAGE